MFTYLDPVTNLLLKGHAQSFCNKIGGHAERLNGNEKPDAPGYSPAVQASEASLPGRAKNLARKEHPLSRTGASLRGELCRSNPNFGQKM
jgi:hypothetical protein